jgi:FMN phosphatase YigB (HAD superfamily)
VHFILDCDDVLLDWIRGFRSWLFDTYRITPTAPAPSSWSLAEWTGVTESRCRELIAEFNASERFGLLNAIPEAVSAVARLKARGHKLTVLTSCSADPAIVGRRRENLNREFYGAFERVICLGLGEPKSMWLAVLRRGIWIEDNYKNALAGHNAGHETIMMRRSHNREDEFASIPHIRWVDDWRSIVSSFA